MGPIESKTCVIQVKINSHANSGSSRLCELVVKSLWLKGENFDFSPKLDILTSFFLQAIFEMIFHLLEIIGNSIL